MAAQQWSLVTIHFLSPCWCNTKSYFSFFPEQNWHLICREGNVASNGLNTSIPGLVIYICLLFPFFPPPCLQTSRPAIDVNGEMKLLMLPLIVHAAQSAICLLSKERKDCQQGLCSCDVYEAISAPSTFDLELKYRCI